MSYRPERTAPGAADEAQPPLLGFPLSAPKPEDGSEPRSHTTAESGSAVPAITTTETQAEGGAGAPVRSFQSASSLQGRQFAEQCDTLLAGCGFRLGGRVNLVQVGIEIDQEAVAPSGRTIWFEYKGSLQGPRPGLMRTDTLKKAIANGALLRAMADRPPFVVLASHVPRTGSGRAMLETAVRLGYLDDVICVYDPPDAARLKGF